MREQKRTTRVRGKVPEGVKSGEVGAIVVERNDCKTGRQIQSELEMPYINA